MVHMEECWVNVLRGGVKAGFVNMIKQLRIGDEVFRTEPPGVVPEQLQLQIDDNLIRLYEAKQLTKKLTCNVIVSDKPNAFGVEFFDEQDEPVMDLF